MKIKTFSIISLIAVFSALLFYNCSLEGTCYYQTEVPVIRFEMPDSIHVDSMATLTVVYVTLNNCSKLNHLADYQSGDTIDIHIIADYDGCNCPDYLPDSIVYYNFEPQAVRNYIFRAWKYDNTLLQDTLVVFDNTLK